MAPGAVLTAESQGGQEGVVGDEEEPRRSLGPVKAAGSGRGESEAGM